MMSYTNKRGRKKGCVGGPGRTKLPIRPKVKCDMTPGGRNAINEHGSILKLTKQIIYDGSY